MEQMLYFSFSIPKRSITICEIHVTGFSMKKEEGNIWQRYQLHCSERTVHWLYHCIPLRALTSQKSILHTDESLESMAFNATSVCRIFFLLAVALKHVAFYSTWLLSGWYYECSCSIVIGLLTVTTAKLFKITIWLSFIFATAFIFSRALNMTFWGKTCFVNRKRGKIKSFTFSWDCSWMYRLLVWFHHYKVSGIISPLQSIRVLPPPHAAQIAIFHCG